MKSVIKRDGSKVDFDVSKIRNQINPACVGTKINPLEFESMINLDISHNVKTYEIQEKLVLIAKNNITDTAPDWDIVAGRLMAHQTMREVWKNVKLEYNDLYNQMLYFVKNELYRPDLKKMYSKEEYEQMGSFMDKTRDYNVTLSQAALLKSKYLLKNKRGIIEYPSTSDMINSAILASIETTNKIDIIKEYYDLLSTYVISLATPFKANLRIPNGNTGSCFIGENGDSNAQIFKAYSDMSTISQQGGGIGWYWGRVRPGDTYTPKVPKANKINKWLKIVNDIAVAVNQRGVRRGAITPALDWWHMDIVDFIEIKSELNGDLRDKCFDIFPQVVVDDYFISAVLNDEDVYKFNHYDFKKLTNIDICDLIGEKLIEAHIKAKELIEAGKLKHFEKVKAKELWVKFLKTWIEYGDFYIVHKDNINLCNYLQEFSIAKCANLCVESYSLSSPTTKWNTAGSEDGIVITESNGMTHSCSLISINVANILNDDGLLKRACYAAVRMLDASIDLGSMPVLEAKTSAELLRNIGVGMVGMADWMAYNKFLYDTDEGRDAGEKLTEKMAWYCYNASIELAKEKGAYPLFKQANYDKMFGKTPEELNKMSKNGFDWVSLREDIRTYGIRNFLINAFAPNSSSALVQGVTASYLPAHSKSNTQKLGGLIVPVLPKYIHDRYWFYKTKFQYKTEDIILFTRGIQRWVDTGISMELTINPAVTNMKKISDAILEGFKNKELKAVYYSLTIDAKKEAACTDCAN